MGFNDKPPAHVSSWYYPVGSVILPTSGILYTLTYYLMTRQSLRDRTYAMPLLPPSLNFAWEFVFFFYVAAAPGEQFIFVVWMLLDMGLVYAVIKYGPYEWAHAPAVGKNVEKILLVMIAWWCWALGRCVGGGLAGTLIRSLGNGGKALKDWTQMSWNSGPRWSLRWCCLAVVWRSFW